MPAPENATIYGIQLRESADDGSDFTNADADYRKVFLGEDGALHAKDSAGTVTSLSGGLTDHTHAVAGSGATGGGASLAPTSLLVDGIMRWDQNLDSSINADQNDWNPGITNIVSIRLTSFTANRTVTGIIAGSSGQILVIVNNTGSSLLLPNESASSSANNRFRCPNAATHTVRTGGSVILLYMAARWCVLAA